MSHGIDTSTGSASLFVAGSSPWHGLGRRVDAPVSSDRAIELAGLNWRVEQQPIATLTPEGARLVDNFVANVRCDTQAVLGVVTREKKPFQNQEIFRFADSLIMDSQAN